jgi:hypothetical protein
MDLTNKDYRKIIQYYKLNKPKNKSYKEVAEETLAGKLCRCIKKVKNDKISEKAAIALCRENIFKKRNIDFYNFKCKEKQQLIHKKNQTKKYLKKFSKNIGFNKTKKSKKNRNKKQ